MDPGIVIFVLLLLSGINLFYYLRTKHFQEMARIEHGLEPLSRDPKRFFKIGIVLISVAIGLISGFILGKALNMPHIVAVPSGILLCGGISLMLFIKPQE